MNRILTIEDDAVTAREIVAELTRNGLDVDWSTTAAKAWSGR